MRGMAARRIREKASTVTERGLISSDEILDAARHRLRKWSPDEIEDGIAALARQTASHAVNALSVMLADRRDLFSASCALLVLLANARSDAALLFQAGYGVIESYRQAQRAMRPRRSDALNELIRQYLDEIPDIGPKELWDDFTRQASDGFSDTLVDFNEDDRVLSFVPRTGAKMEDIDFVAFRKRVQRVRATLAGSCRNHCSMLASNG